MQGCVELVAELMDTIMVEVEQTHSDIPPVLSLVETAVWALMVQEGACVSECYVALALQLLRDNPIC